MWFLYSKEKLKVKFLLLKIDNQSQLKWQPVIGKGKETRKYKIKQIVISRNTKKIKDLTVNVCKRFYTNNFTLISRHKRKSRNVVYMFMVVL